MCDRQRHCVVETAAVRVELPDLHRLLPRRDPPRRNDGRSGHLYLDPRFDRHGRRRADPSTDRTTRVVACDARHGAAAPGRRQRGGRSLACRDATQGSAGEPGAVAPSAADARPQRVRERQRRRARCLRARRRSRRQARCAPAGDRQRSRAVHHRLRTTEERRHPCPRRQHAVVGPVREPERRIPRQRAAARQWQRESRSRRHRPWVGSAMSDSAARSSACVRSACRRRARSSKRISASMPRTSSLLPSNSWRGMRRPPKP